LHAIGRRGACSLDALIEKLDLPARVVASALTELELGGSIRYRARAAPRA
jgi:predicted Rossmann fold nucleotide-binding protein DprA/Smf involved in DNA uptake